MTMALVHELLVEEKKKKDNAGVLFFTPCHLLFGSKGIAAFQMQRTGKGRWFLIHRVAEK
jgi:hypothetical protein